MHETFGERVIRSIYDFEVAKIDGTAQDLAAFRGRVLLIVNVASRCGFTSQYADLEAVYRRHRHEGLTILGFPCDQFGHQEPGNEAEIKNFCARMYDVTFPLFAKVKVNGRAAHPLFAYLKSARKGLLGTESIKWNFTKFLVDRTGTVTKRYAPTARPVSIERDIELLLA